MFGTVQIVCLEPRGVFYSNQRSLIHLHEVSQSVGAKDSNLNSLSFSTVPKTHFELVLSNRKHGANTTTQKRGGRGTLPPNDDPERQEGKEVPELRRTGMVVWAVHVRNEAVVGPHVVDEVLECIPGAPRP